MKKVLAIVIALTMVMAFSACGGKNEETPTEAPTENVTSPAEDATVPAESETVPATDVPVSDPTVAASETAVDVSNTEVGTTAAASKGLNSTDVKAVIDFYNAAVKATNGKAPKGKQTMKLVDGSLDGDGAVGAIVKVLEPAAVKALEKNSVSTDYIPSDKDDLLASDAVSATATSKNGVTTIEIKLKQQVDGPNANGHSDGPVARGIGTLGSIETALSELGATISEGKDTVKLTYNNAYIKCTVDEATGTITGGTWHHLVNVNIGNAKAKISILSATLKNFKGQIDFKVVL